MTGSDQQSKSTGSDAAELLRRLDMEMRLAQAQRPDFGRRRQLFRIIGVLVLLGFFVVVLVGMRMAASALPGQPGRVVPAGVEAGK